MDTDMTGLSAQEVQERRERGEGGTGAKSITKSRVNFLTALDIHLELLTIESE